MLIKKIKKGELLIQNKLRRDPSRDLKQILISVIFIIYFSGLGRALLKPLLDETLFYIIHYGIMGLYFILLLWFTYPLLPYLKIHEKGMIIRRQKLFLLSFLSTKFFHYNDINTCDLKRNRIPKKGFIKKKKNIRLKLF